MITPRPPLPEGYYLDHFRTVVAEVEARYGDLLQVEEQQLLARVQGLSLAAQRLLVRMLGRRGPWFRRDALRYPEIGDPEPPLRELAAANLVARAAAPEVLEPLLTRADLLDLLATHGIAAAKTTGRDGLRDRLFAEVPAEVLADALHARLQPAALLQAGLWRLVFLLFFGNFEQDLSSFVVADLGHVRFEAYPLDPRTRLFQARADLDYLLDLRGLRERLEGAAGLQTLEALSDQALAMEGHPGVRQQRRFHRLLNDLGQAWERAGHLDRAWACYLRSDRPPAGERRARILAARGELEAACRLAAALAEAPRDESEARFGRVFLKRFRRRVGFAAEWLEAHPGPPALSERRLDVPLRGGTPVEEVALEAAREAGWDGFFAENLLWRGLFGLALWAQVFAEVPGAFQHRFQAAPLDLGGPDFHAHRADLIEARLAALAACPDLAGELLATYDRKQGLANPFVNWRHLGRTQVEAAALRIAPPVLAAVCRILARNPLAFDSGFPDLFLFRPGGTEWRLWEVKGGRDRLRPEQEAWLQRFRALGVVAEVVRLG